jgi:hypothetical protein
MSALGPDARTLIGKGKNVAKEGIRNSCGGLDGPGILVIARLVERETVDQDCVPLRGQAQTLQPAILPRYGTGGISIWLLTQLFKVGAPF